MRLKTIIIDDEKASIESLVWELKDYQVQLEVVATCDSPERGLEAIRALRPGLVFLDIEMPSMNGFQLLEKVGDIDFEVVFITAYDEFAVRAFKVNAIDYLMKPIDQGELKRAISKVVFKRQYPLGQQNLTSLLAMMNLRKPVLPSIVFPTLEGLEFIEVEKIAYCQSDSNYTRLYLENGESVMVSKTLKQVEAMLQEFPFCRVHHSFLVHLVFIKKYLRGKGGNLVLKNGETIPVARSRKEELLQLF